MLTGLRHAKVPLTLGTIRAIIIARINTDLPQLFVRKARDGSIFRASAPWCRRFLHREMQWSIRHATRAADGELRKELTNNLRHGNVVVVVRSRTRIEIGQQVRARVDEMTALSCQTELG